MTFPTTADPSGSTAGRVGSLRRLAAACSIVILGAVALAGCGGSDDDIAPPPDYAKALAGSPAPLAALYQQGDELLPGGKPAFEARMKQLKGFPAVVNLWASWCGPCRAELPHFQQLSAELGKEVAFLGVNSKDSDELAGNLLEDFPLPYPSFSDPDSEIFDSLLSSSRSALPATVFFDADGNQTYAKPGQYPSEEALRADIQTFAIEGKTE